MEKGPWLEREMDEMVLMNEIAEFMAYCFAVPENKEKTAGGGE